MQTIPNFAENMILAIGLFFEIYSIILHGLNFVKKTQMSDLSFAAGIFFLVGLLSLFLRGQVTWILFLLLLFLLIITRYGYIRLGQLHRSRRSDTVDPVD